MPFHAIPNGTYSFHLPKCFLNAEYHVTDIQLCKYKYYRYKYLLIFWNSVAVRNQLNNLYCFIYHAEKYRLQAMVLRCCMETVSLNVFIAHQCLCVIWFYFILFLLIFKMYRGCYLRASNSVITHELGLRESKRGDIKMTKNYIISILCILVFNKIHSSLL